MADLHDTLQAHVSKGSVPGAVGLVARGDRVDVAAVGAVDVEGSAPMARDSIFRIASITKPIVAAAVMTLVEDGRIALADPVRRWLPELAAPSVVRTPESPLDDVVPAVRPITVFHVLSSCTGYGFASDFSLPAVEALFTELKQGRPQPQGVPEPDAWLAALARIPLLHQPGDGWLYNLSSDLQGLLISRVTGMSLPDFLTERIFEPLGMTDTAFSVPPGKLDRFTSFYGSRPEGGLELLDAADGEWSVPPVFPSGAGGLVSTVDDWLAFGRMLLAEGTAGGLRLLSAESVLQMTTNHLTVSERQSGGLFLEGMGWGFGGAVDVDRVEPWSVPGRYGWVGGTGTTAHVVPATGTVTVMMSQLQMGGPSFPDLMRDFWAYAATA
ncbi:serine hydrolase domain-containing protein [Streptomyces sp. NPDC050658]|uniref:serine hydrolase domain-containing protein n=1 Tax=unclassified Streptomyces TaxID=2593676 RepID=UPI0034154531